MTETLSGLFDRILSDGGTLSDLNDALKSSLANYLEGGDFSSSGKTLILYSGDNNVNPTDANDVF